MNMDIAAKPRLTILASACLCLALQGCIDRPGTEDEGPVDPGDPDPVACTHLPAAATQYKGGDTLGEELTLSLDPATLAYTLTIDASLQRNAGAQRSGTLTQLDSCSYSSAENGAVFTLAAGGVVQGGIAAPSGDSFAALLAFSSSFQNADTPTVFNPVASIYNFAGVQYDGSAAAGDGGAGRLRNAGTFQLCRDAATAGFTTYDAGCTDTAKGYLSYNAGRSAFDLYSTPADGGAVTTGGTLSGSMVIGLVGDGTVAFPLELLRASATSYGMRLYTPQQALASGTADGSYAVIDSSGSNATATLSGGSFSREGSSATLSYDTPAAGVVQAAGTLSGHLLYGSGIYGFVADTAGPAFELGVAR